MLHNIVYAKKLILPSNQANSLQSLQMAAAFSKLGRQTFFYPGLNYRKISQANSKTQDDINIYVIEILKSLGIEHHVAEFWQFQPAQHKGLYGVRFRGALARRFFCSCGDLFYARDLSEACLISRLTALPRCGRRHKFVYEMHEILFKQHRDLEKRSDWERTKSKERRALSAADGLVATNQALADAALHELGYVGPVLVEPNGINEDIFNPVKLFDEQTPWPTSKDPVLLVYIGSFKKGKGVSELIQAMTFLPCRFHLKLIGKGSLEATSDLRREIEKVPNGFERIVLTGLIPPKNIKEECQGAHISVIPQQSDGGYFSPLKLNESLALGLPSICTPLPIFASQNNLMYKTDDCTPKALAAAIIQLADQPELAYELRRQGIIAASHYTWRARAGRILDFISQS